MAEDLLPDDLNTPEVALATPVGGIPRPNALPGGCVYEPKWDGYRCTIVVDDDGARLWSRNGKELTGYFPELAAAVGEQVPAGFVVDGEVGAWKDGRLDFGVLQHRLTAGVRIRDTLARTEPVSYAAFDVLAVAGRDARGLAWRERRALLEELASGWQPPLHLSPVTSDLEVAQQWFEDTADAGIEGLVVKGAGQAYRPGVRQWLKIKRRDTYDVVAAAVTGTMSSPQALVVGLPVGGTLRIAGRTGPLSPTQVRALRPHLRPAEPDSHPWPAEVKASAISRIGAGKDTIRLTLIEPLVVEVSADSAWSGQAFRHQVRYLRARPEIDPADVTVPAALDVDGEGGNARER